MKLVVLSEAEVEAARAGKWYEGQRRELGVEFFDDLEIAFHTIESHPTSQPLLESSESTDHEFRRAMLKRFPYLIIFTIRGDEILVVAVAHAHRKPGYWLDRVS